MTLKTGVLAPEFQEFVQLLCDHSVRYLMIGGYALAAYGFGQTTEDLDLWFDPSLDNTERLSRVSGLFGVRPFSALELQEANQVFQLGFVPNRIDLVNLHHPTLSFETAFSRRTLSDDGASLEISIVSLEDLKTLKQYANRIGDLADLEFIARLERRNR